MNELPLKSARFRQEREKSWKALEALIGRIEKSGLRTLSSAERYQLPVLYRGAVSSLSVARAISLDRALLEYLEALVRRAYVHVYTVKEPAGEFLRRFFVTRFPTAVFSLRFHLAAAMTILLLGILTGYTMTSRDSESYYSFIPEAMAQGRTPAASTEELRKVLYGGGDHGGDSLVAFAAQLFSHNAGIGILCFALGFLAAIPTVILLYYNGMILGAMAALYASRGLGNEFWAWVMGHGVTELGAIVLCGGAGMALGSALIHPGRFTRQSALAAAGRRGGPVIVGSVCMFLIAGLIEGIFRQTVEAESIRWIMTGTTLLLWVAYFFVWGSRASRSSANMNR